MARDYIRTSEVAKAVGVHPNTVRMYEAWGLLPAVPRTPSGYRKFTPRHVDQLRLVRLVYDGPWPGRTLRRSAVALLKQAAGGDLGGALEGAYRHVAVVQAEGARAESAVRLLERWADGTSADATLSPLRIGQAAALLGVSRDVLRNWERNTLVRVPRNPRNGYRLYGASEISRLRVVRMLSQAGYSMMAILRMMAQLDAGAGIDDLRTALDTPRPEDDVYTAADQWLTALEACAQRAEQMIELLEGMIARTRGTDV